MTQEQDFQKDLDRLHEQWPPSERHLIHDAAARQLGDMLRQYPDKLDTILDLFGEALRRSDARHVGLLWTCLRGYAPEYNRQAASRRFLAHLEDRVDPHVFRQLAIGVVKPGERTAFFQGTWPIMEAHWAHTGAQLATQTACGLVGVALTDPQVIPMLAQLLDRDEVERQDFQKVVVSWGRAVSYAKFPSPYAQATLDQILKVAGDSAQRLIDDLFERTCQLIESLGPGDQRADNGGKCALGCLLVAGADWTRQDPGRYPQAWSLVLAHPRVVALRLAELAGLDQAAGRAGGPKRHF